MTATSNFKLSKATEKRVSELTLKLKTQWRKSTEAVLEVGKCLHELKQLFPRKDFIAHVKKEIGISEKHAMRIIQVYRRFGNYKRSELLKVKPTVLYELAYRCTDSQIAKLQTEKSIQTLKVSDVPKRKLRSCFDLERELATFFEEVQDETFKFKRMISNRKPLSERAALRITLKETIGCLREINSVL